MLFAAQFGGAGFRHIPRLGCYSSHIFLFEGWVWPGFWGCVACWNRPHIFLQSAAPKAKGSCCYWRHNSQGILFRTGLLLTTQLGVQQTAAARWLGLLFAAHFKAGRARRLFSGILHAGLLFSAHFLIAHVPVFIEIPLIFVFYQELLLFAHFYGLPPLSPRIHHSRQRKCWVVIHSTILYTAFFIRFPNCVSANSPGKYNLAGKILSASPSKKFSSSPLLSSAHFKNLKNSFHFSPPTIAQQKYFLRQFML